MFLKPNFEHRKGKISFSYCLLRTQIISVIAKMCESLSPPTSKQQTPARHPLSRFKSNCSWRLHQLSQVESCHVRYQAQAQTVSPELLADQLWLGVCTIPFSGSIHLLKENIFIIVKNYMMYGIRRIEGAQSFHALSGLTLQELGRCCAVQELSILCLLWGLWKIHCINN